MDEIGELLGIGSVQYGTILKVLVAMVLGGVIGYDRESAHKPAGLRTHMLVAAAAALFVGLGFIILNSYEARLQAGEIRSDPIRIFEAIITGVSFLGAGTIIRHHGEQNVEGITTAASLLMTAAIGATVGLSQWFLAVVLTGLVYGTLRLLHGAKRAANNTGAAGT